MIFTLITVLITMTLIIGLTRALKLTFKSNNIVAKSLTLLAIIAFFVQIVLWSIPWMKNANGKSFNAGWFAVAYSGISALFVLTLVCWLLSLLGKKSD